MSYRNPLVSIIVPIYNVENYLDECMDSIKAQTFSNIEIILVEDCSTDASLKCASAHLEDPRVKLIRHDENRGLSVARNTGIEHATGKYTIFIDSDDVAHHSLVQICVNAMEQENLDVIVFDFEAFVDSSKLSNLTNSGELTPRTKVLNEIEYFQYPHFAWLKVIRTEVLNSKGLRFIEGQNYEDWPFHWQIGFVVQDIRKIEKVLLYYRLRGDSITGVSNRKLFHIFTSNLSVARIAIEFSAGADVKGILSAKMYRGLWFVLSKIKIKYIWEAIPRAQRYFGEIQKLPIPVDRSAKDRVLCAILNFPKPFAFAALLTIRVVRLATSTVRKDR